MKRSSPHTVGTRELKTRLGTYLRLVRRGARLIITDRGRPIAELHPLAQSPDDIEAVMEEMIQLGDASRASTEPLQPFEPIAAKGSPLSQTVIDDREDRL